MEVSANDPQNDRWDEAAERTELLDAERLEPIKGSKQRRPDRVWRRRASTFNGIHRRRKKRPGW